MGDTEKLSQMMIRCGLATGHGDTIDDLIFELEKQIRNTSNAFSDARKQIERLREALEPFAKKYLWPDDSGYADELRADEDWSEVGNDGYLDSCLIQRKWIRDAREALRVMEIAQNALEKE